MPALTLSILPDGYAICRLEPGAPVPGWALAAPGFASITRTRSELSVVVIGAAVPSGIRHESGWRIFELQGPFAFTEIGILASVADPLRDAKIGIFAISTFDTDYVLVKAGDLGRAIDVLENAGHTVRSAQ